MSVAGILSEAFGYDHPGLALSVVKVWAKNAEGVAQILKEKETFDFEPAQYRDARAVLFTFDRHHGN
jgi:hypothetical protein